MSVRLHFVLPFLLLLSLGCGLGDAMRETRAKEHLGWSARARALPESPEREAVLALLDRTYFCVKDRTLFEDDQLAMRDAFADAVTDDALTALEVERITRAAGNKCGPPALTGEALAAALATKRAEEDVLAAKEVKAAVVEERRAVNKAAREFTTWELPGGIVRQAAAAGWTMESCTSTEDKKVMHLCQLRKEPLYAEVDITHWKTLDAARDDVTATQDAGGTAERDGAWVLNVFVWNTDEAEALREAVIPPGDRLRGLTNDILKARLKKLGWSVSECAVTLDQDETLSTCRITRPGARGGTRLSVEAEVDPDPLESRELDDQDARIFNEDASFGVRIQRPEEGSKLKDAMLEPAVEAAVGAPAPVDPSALAPAAPSTPAAPSATP